jgi:hypothetical protein
VTSRPIGGAISKLDKGSPMIRTLLLEMNQLEAAKETVNKLRWDLDVDGTRFSLYIPKWRVPEPWPSRICINIFPRRATCDDLPNVTQTDVSNDGTLRQEPIVATVLSVEEMTKTIHYRPVGDQKEWEIGEPYIPFALTDDRSQRLRLIVQWDLTSRGMFFGPATVGP